MTKQKSGVKRNSTQIAGSRDYPVQNVESQSTSSSCFKLIDAKESCQRRRMRRRCSKVGKMFHSNALTDFLSEFSSDTIQSKASKSESFEVSAKNKKNRRCSNKVGKMFNSTNNILSLVVVAVENEDRSYDGKKEAVQA